MTAVRHLKPVPQGLTADHLSKSYRRRPVLKDVSLSVKRGEAVALLGPNGAGKTTCFYILTGLIAADSGAIRIDGQEITALPMYRRARLGIGYLPQESSIFRGLNVEDNLRASPRRLSGMSRNRFLKNCSSNFPSPICAGLPRPRCRGESGGGSKSPARWPAARNSSCWMNRSPGSTPSRSGISAPSSNI